MGTADKCTISYGTYIRIMIKKILNYTMEIYIWSQAGKNE